MSVKIRKGYQAEITAKGFGSSLIFAETLAELDAQVEAHFKSLEAARQSQQRAVLARLAGRERQLYKAARDALDSPEAG